MTREVWYMGAPVGAPTPAEVRENLERALEWLAFLRRREPGVAIIAPWLAVLFAGVEDDGDPEQRKRGLLDACAIAARCDGIVLVGGRTSVGMQLELDAAIETGAVVADLTSLGASPPIDYDAQYSDPALERGPVSPLEVGRAVWRAR